MRSSWIALSVVALVVIAGAAPGAQSNTLKGAWKVVAVTGADGKTDNAPQPGLFIFTDRHYSIQVVREPRTALPAKATDAQVAAAYNPYTANSGTYDVKGTTLTRHVVVAKNPNVMTSTTPVQEELKWEGPGTVSVTGTAAGGSGKVVTKLQRIE